MTIKIGWVYMMTNRPNGTLYTGVTADLVRRVYEHRDGLAGGFTGRYGLRMLVYFERHETIGEAIARETVIKNWHRAYKIRLIVAVNPDWRDLYPEIVGG